MNNIINETFTKHLGLLQQHLKPVMKEGKMNQLSMDLKELSDEEFKRKHGKTKSEIRSLLNVKEGKMNQLSMDLKELSDEEFKRKHGKTKSEIKAMLAMKENDDGYDSRRDAAYSRDGYVHREPRQNFQKRFPSSTVKKMYFYNVPSGKNSEATNMGLRQTKSGKWYSPKPIDIATKEFGSPKEWSPKN